MAINEILSSVKAMNSHPDHHLVTWCHPCQEYQSWFSSRQYTWKILVPPVPVFTCSLKLKTFHKIDRTLWPVPAGSWWTELIAWQLYRWLDATLQLLIWQWLINTTSLVSNAMHGVFRAQSFSVSLNSFTLSFLLTKALIIWCHLAEDGAFRGIPPLTVGGTGSLFHQSLLKQK